MSELPWNIQYVLESTTFRTSPDRSRIVWPLARPVTVTGGGLRTGVVDPVTAGTDDEPGADGPGEELPPFPQPESTAPTSAAAAMTSHQTRENDRSRKYLDSLPATCGVTVVF